MNAQTWLPQFRMAGNILIQEGKNASSILDDKKKRGKGVKDRLKPATAEFQTDEEGITRLRIDDAKGKEFLTGDQFYTQINAFVDLLADADSVLTEFEMPSYMTFTRFRASKETSSSISGMLHKVSESYRVKSDYQEEWDTVLKATIPAYIQRVSEMAEQIHLYIEERAKEVADARGTKPKTTAVIEEELTEGEF